VRLDHLLSKEHLHLKGCEGPASPGCGGGVLDGGDTGEFFPGNGRVLLVRPCVWWRERGVWCGWGGVVGTLLGPEGTTVRVVVVVSEPCAGPCGFRGLPGMAWSRIPDVSLCGGGVLLVWGGVGCGLVVC
jgi:hypothetical protein